jgi:hypothetical protein
MVMQGLFDAQGNPRFTKSYLIPVGDLSLDDRGVMRRDTDITLMENALRLKVRDAPEDLIIRDPLPNTDLGLAAQEDWLIAGAGVVAVELQYFNPALATTRVLGFYGVSVESAPPSISRVRLTQGAASTTVKGVFQLEPLYSRLETAGYFSESVIFPPNQVVRVMVMPRLAFAVNTERLAFLARIVEPIGDVVSTPSI